MKTREEINLYKKMWKIKRRGSISCKKCKAVFVPFGTQLYCKKECRPKGYHKFLYYKVCEVCCERYDPQGRAQKYCIRCKNKDYKFKGITMKI